MICPALLTSPLNPARFASLASAIRSNLEGLGYGG